MSKASSAQLAAFFLTSLIMALTLTVQANDQVQYATENKLLKIPSAVIDDVAQVYDVEMSLQSNGQFALTQINEEPKLQANINETFTLKMDESIWLKDIDAHLKLVAVAEDSRCPIDAICITDGPVRLVFAIFNKTIHTNDLLLTHGIESFFSIAEKGNFRIILGRVSPLPASGRTSADYEATLIINGIDE